MVRAALLVSLPALAVAFLPSGGVPGLRSQRAGAATMAGLGRPSPLFAAPLASRKASLHVGRATPVMMGNAVNNPDYQYLEERDACGVGFVATRKGEATHDVVHKVSPAPGAVGQGAVGKARTLQRGVDGAVWGSLCRLGRPFSAMPPFQPQIVPVFSAPVPTLSGVGGGPGRVGALVVFEAGRLGLESAASHARGA